ncbi:MAG: hypothetical protein Q8Q41_01975, partial [bacterium]|nr:hypothetical protein [bacterium]
MIAVLILYFGVFNQQQPSDNQQIKQQASEVPRKQWETKTDEQPSVTIAVTPVEFGGDVKTWRFTVVLDTHLGSLDEDPTQIAMLMDDKGNTYQPTAWEGQGPGGHHREGVLVFNANNPVPAYV